MRQQEVTQLMLVRFQEKGLEASQRSRPYWHTTVHRVPEEQGDTLPLEWFEEQHQVGLRLVFLWCHPDLTRARDCRFAVIWQSQDVQSIAGNCVEGWYLYLDETDGDGALNIAACDYARTHGLNPDEIGCPIPMTEASLVMEDMFHYFLSNRKRSHKELSMQPD